MKERGSGRADADFVWLLRAFRFFVFLPTVSRMRECSPAVGDVVAAIELFCSSAAFSEEQFVAADMLELSRAKDMLDLKFSEMAAAFAQTDQFASEGSLSPIHWTRHNCHLTSGAVAGRLAVGERLDDVPESVAAMREGEIGFAHLSLIAGEAAALAEKGGGQQFDETRLLKKAREFSVGRFRNFCHHERHRNDPEGYAADQAEAVEARTLSLKVGEGGMVWIRGVLDPEGGAVLRTALEPLAQRTGKGDTRTRDRRFGDAMIELAHHELDGGTPGTPPRGPRRRPHLQVTTTLETLLQRCGSPAGELEYSLPISARAVERMACDCSVTRFLLGADSQVIDVGRTTRRIRPAMRKALHVRDRRCRWPGCDRPASWTSGHHLEHWVRGGPTELSNLVLLCHRHHWMVHEGGWQIVRKDDGDFVVLPPPMDVFGHLARGPGEDSAA